MILELKTMMLPPNEDVCVHSQIYFAVHIHHIQSNLVMRIQNYTDE